MYTFLLLGFNSGTFPLPESYKERVDGPAQIFLDDVEKLDLFSNSIGDEGAKALAAVLPSMSELKALNLEGNSIGDEGAKESQAHKT